MSLSTSNLLSPASNALNNYLNPSPLKPIVTPPAQPTALKTAPISSGAISNLMSSSPNYSNVSNFLPTSTYTPTQTGSLANYVNPNSQFQNSVGSSVFGGGSSSGSGTSSTYVPPAVAQNTQQNTQSSYTAPQQNNNGSSTDTGNQNNNQQQNNQQQNNQNQQQNQDQITYAGLIAQLQKQASQPSQAYTDALAQAQQYNQQLGESRTNEANALAVNNQNPIPLEFQQGRGGILQNQYLAQQNALSNQYQGATNLLSAANTQQGLQQSGLASAISATAPRQNGYVLINPQTGQLQGGNGTTGGNAINQGAQYDAQYSGALANATDNQAIQGAQNNIDSITQLIQNGGLNGQKLNVANETYQTLQKNLSNSDYQTLNNSLGAINAALTKVTGSPIDVAQLSTTQGTSLITAINNAVQIAKGIAAGKMNNSNTQNYQSNSKDPLNLGI